MQNLSIDSISKKILEDSANSQAFFTDNITSLFSYLLNQFTTHNKRLDNISKEYKLAKNQQDYFRSISLHGIFKHSIENNKALDIPPKIYSIIAKYLKKFPKIGDTSYDSSDNIRFEPILNLNLLKINQAILIDFVSLLNSENKENGASYLKKNIESESREITKRIGEIEEEISKVPEVLNKAPKLRSDCTTSKDKPKVSIITMSYNLAPLVEETMQSITNQNSSFFEHIVIDGRSTDGSLDVLKKYPHIRLISEKDTGYPDAFWKGLKMARGEYVMQCAISDGYANKNWVKMCIDTLDNNKDISLVWGFPGRLAEDSKLSAIARPQFHYNAPPKEEKFFNYWLMSYFIYPEGNLCARKSVMEKCYPTLDELNNNNMLDWLEFSFRFNRLGYIAKNIPVMANFGRTHGNQLGEQLSLDGSLKKKYKNYRKKLRKYRNNILLGLTDHKFINSNGNIIHNRIFDRKNFLKEYLAFLSIGLFKINKIYFMPSKYINYMKRKLKI